LGLKAILDRGFTTCMGVLGSGCMDSPHHPGQGLPESMPEDLMNTPHPTRTRGARRREQQHLVKGAGNVGEAKSEWQGRTWEAAIPVSYTHLTLPTTPYV